MPRKKTLASPPQPATLALSDLHIYLDSLEKEHQSLLKQIKKKRTELNNFVEQMRSLATEMFHRISPSFVKIAEIDQEIHALFKEIFASRKFGKQTQEKVEKVYFNLQASGIITKKIQIEEDDTELDEMFENFKSDDDNFQSENTYGYQQRQVGREEVSSVSKPKTDESRRIRQTFLKLAEIFHPDKVTDSETQMSHTEIMKEINKAYQEGDLARLLEIEKKYELGEEIDKNSESDLSRKCRIIEQQNEILKTQYENLKRELRLAKNTPEGAMVSDYRKAAKQNIDGIGLMLKAVESQVKIIAGIRDFVQDFKDKKITIKEFLAGPESLRASNERIVEEMLEDMLSQLGIDLDMEF
ncbi:hypothetical protein B6N60_00355 [Richelia sinica FACHB-800]|uniref:Molecular chaperone DnaJ n=1 Tax=Richelia sinica FACHB-800 TaxID=1357546 RepID=A0A975T3U6_9NOST|nr:J domain-containing protein [Richelia sinica]MBD2662846.1 J domain-containing protein [Richelia sinica FACHB-800]QXE21678.1 hypothetical protein B6N60_00355 [Richelia sinica FACHB-800]